MSLCLYLNAQLVAFLIRTNQQVDHCNNQSECNDQADDVYNTVAGSHQLTGEQVAQLVYVNSIMYDKIML